MKIDINIWPSMKGKRKDSENDVENENGSKISTVLVVMAIAVPSYIFGRVCGEATALRKIVPRVIVHHI